MDDTSPEIAEKIREMFQEISPIERLKMGCSMYETSKYLVTRAILEDNPGITASALRQEFFLKFYGNDFRPSQIQKILEHIERCTFP